MNITVYSRQTYKPGLVYLVYKKIRAPAGIPLGFILMYGTYTGSLIPSILLAGCGFFCIELFGACYNDYWDYEEDIRNNRGDKFTTLGLLTREEVRNISFMIVSLALLLLGFTNIWVFLLGVYYLILFICYSHPKVRLKGHITGYVALASMFLFLPMALNSLIMVELTWFSIVFALFFFLQFMYILCQKDSTDPEDDKNIFIDAGWRQSSLITLVFAILSSLFLLGISAASIWLLPVWGINAFSKILNVTKIYRKRITRNLRSKLILIEFLTPYLYIGVIAIGL